MRNRLYCMNVRHQPCNTCRYLVFLKQSYDYGLVGTGFERCYARKRVYLCASMQIHGQRVVLVLSYLYISTLDIKAVKTVAVVLFASMLGFGKYYLSVYLVNCLAHRV